MDLRSSSAKMEDLKSADTPHSRCYVFLRGSLRLSSHSTGSASSILILARILVSPCKNSKGTKKKKKKEKN